MLLWSVEKFSDELPIVVRNFIYLLALTENLITVDFNPDFQFIIEILSINWFVVDRHFLV